jgi:ABC-type transporter Mla subunit MlaD
METRTPHWRLVLLPVGFALACIIVTLGLYTAFGGSTPFAPEGYRVSLPLPEATNLVPGSGVQIAGVKIGRIVSVTRQGNGARVTIELQTRFAPLRIGASAIARTKTLLGEGYIEIAPGPRSARPIPDGGQLPAARVDHEVQLDQFLSTFDPATRARLRETFAGLAAATRGRGPALNDVLGELAPFTTSLDQVLGTVRAQQVALRRVVASSGDVLGTVGDESGAARAAVTSGNALLDATARRNVALSRTVTALAPFLGQLRTTSNAVTAASPTLNAAVGALLPAAPLLAPALRSVDRAAPQFRGLFAELPSVLQTGTTALPSLTRIVRATRAGFKQFYPTSRELIPFMQLLALNRNIVDILANVADVTSGSFVGPGGKVIGTASGVITVWNETISGWTHKLPTNRQNPYPKPPDALLETGQLGVLKAYDCRNIHNPLVIPPTGTGAPPCILQGPWPFNGKSAYYPRLTLAPQ